MHEFHNPADREIASLFAALLAYGNVKQIIRSARALFAAMDNQPASFVDGFRYRDARERMHGFKHRFTDGEDILCLCWLLHQAQRLKPLEAHFVDCVRSDDADLAPALGRFVARLLAQSFRPHFSRQCMLAKQSFRHLLPDPVAGSACKRLNLWLRWVVRPDDGLDLGLWRSVDRASLIIPVDTHIMRISQAMGLLERRSGSLAAAREITAALREIDAKDPVRFDFSLCRLGILKQCPVKRNAAACDACELRPVCLCPQV